MDKTTPHCRNDYTYFFNLSTRWMDNDIYGHVNNVVYYSYFDTIVNQYLIEHGGLDIHNGESIGLMVNSQCQFFASIAFPSQIEGGFRVNRIGNSSVEYGLAIFVEGKPLACAQGSLTHVFVERMSQRPQKIGGAMREALEKAQTNK